MAPTVRILDINPGSDGDGRKWPKHHYTRNDEYFKERIATDKWIKDLPGGPEPDVTYRLNKLPNGYAGFERQRPDSKHVDRYIYGHQNGQFRSLNEFYPHFKHLMDYGGPAGCTCKLCLGGNGRKKSKGGIASVSRDESERSTTPPRRSKYFVSSAEPQDSGDLRPYLISPFHASSKDNRHNPESPQPSKKKLVDLEGTPDMYEILLTKLREGNREDVVDVPFEELLSPDWRASHLTVKSLLREWRDLPQYVPRIGELVLFVRHLGNGKLICWDGSTQTFRCTNDERTKWLDKPTWEAGVVTQMPQEAILDGDLFTNHDKEQAINYSGFRIEPLSEPGSQHKPYSKQYKHVPLHAIRPLVYYQECLNGTPENEWHPTIKHALITSSSFCLVRRYRFHGKWPNATVFARGLYIGPELVMVGDTVRLLPKRREQSSSTVTDIMVVTAIRLRFVNLDLQEEDGGAGDVLPYQTCVHVSGRVYTLDPTRSFESKKVGPSILKVLPNVSSGTSVWYHYSDPRRDSLRIEVPYTRVLGRHFESTATYAWFKHYSNLPINPASVTLGKLDDGNMTDVPHLSRGLEGLVKARQYSRQNDKRIKSQEGKAWFWADSRAEQLDLHEVNGRFVGLKDDNRTPEELRKLQSTLKALDGKKGALEEFQKAKKANAAENTGAALPSAYAMVAASRHTGTRSPSDQDSEGNENENEDAMEVDDEHGLAQDSEVMEDDNSSEPGPIVTSKVEPVTVYDSEDDSEDEDDIATNQLVGELAKNIRPNDPRLR